MRITLRGALAALVTTIAFAATTSPALATTHTWTWNGQSLTKAKPFTGKGVLSFDEKALNEQIKCEGVEESGKVGPGAVGEITSIAKGGAKLISCGLRSGRGCQTKINMEALRLPWHTELATVNGELRYVITENKTGETAWKLACEGESQANNECYAGTNSGISNITNGVEAFFDEKSPTNICVDTPPVGFSTSGGITMTDPEGGALGVK
jgi:hypothetical protein